MAEEKIKLTELYKNQKDKSINLSTDAKTILLSISKNISVMKENTTKLVKKQSGLSKSESFFQKSAEKERLYEEKFKRIDTTPTRMGDSVKIKEGGPGFFDFITNIFSFILKGGILGTLVVGIGKLLEDPEIRKTLKQFATDAFVALFNGIKSVVNFIGDVLQDPKVIASIVDTVETIFTVIKNTLLKILNHEVETEYGKFSVGTILASLVGALYLFKKGLESLGNVIGKIGGGPTPPTVPTGGPGKPTTPVPPGGPTSGKTTPPTAEPKEKPGFLKTAEDKIRERAQKGAGAGKDVLKRFFSGALRFGALAGPWGTAYTLYQIADYLSPDEQQQLADSIGVLASVQQDIDEIEAGPGTKEQKQKRIDILKQRSRIEFYEDRLKSLLPPVQALPSSPDESEAERNRLNLKPESVSTETSDMRQGRGYNRSPTPTSGEVGEVSDSFIDFIKQKENPYLFKNKGVSKAFWDYKQYSIGYGTKANSPDEVITEQEADKGLRDELSKSQKSVIDYAKKYNYDFNENQTEALTSFVYNLGPGILDQLTAKGTRSIEEISQKIPEYNKAGGKVLAGLVKRRQEELSMFNKPVPVSPEITGVGGVLASMTKDVEFEKELMKLMQPVVNNVTNNNVNNQIPSSGGGTSLATASVYDDLFASLLQRALQ